MAEKPLTTLTYGVFLTILRISAQKKNDVKMSIEVLETVCLSISYSMLHRALSQHMKASFDFGDHLNKLATLNGRCNGN